MSYCELAFGRGCARADVERLPSSFMCTGRGPDPSFGLDYFDSNLDLSPDSDQIIPMERCVRPLSLFHSIGRWSGRETDASQAERLDRSCLSIARSALSLARSAHAERDNESYFFVRAAGVYRLIRPSASRCDSGANYSNISPTIDFDVGLVSILNPFLLAIGIRLPAVVPIRTKPE
ncbi:hypothetical protein EVAR_78857_1 [Eumeta japonica]|uniref:Uncharacterized protein n=1 Tax=Eumeta variegata TaxID=151549 RepID=A0A4C1U2E0_EUMVA|nr:hypothetical protein EVAR_78857_1 [Eumeta japonica]